MNSILRECRFLSSPALAACCKDSANSQHKQNNPADTRHKSIKRRGREKQESSTVVHFSLRSQGHSDSAFLVRPLSIGFLSFKTPKERLHFHQSSSLVSSLLMLVNKGSFQVDTPCLICKHELISLGISLLERY